MADLNLADLQAELDKMSPEDLKKFVLDAKVKQKVATKKYYNADAAKVQRQKRAALLKAAIDHLKATGQMDAIEAQAREQADAKLAEEETAEVES